MSEVDPERVKRIDQFILERLPAARTGGPPLVSLRAASADGVALGVETDLALSAVEPVHDAILSHLQTSAGRNVVLDLSRVRFIDSTGLGLLVRLRSEVQQLGGSLILAGVQRGIASKFKELYLDRLFPEMTLALEDVLRRRQA